MAPLTRFVTAFAILMPAANALSALTYVGCFKSSTGLTVAENTFQYQSSGHCQGVCVDNNDNAPAMGLTNGDQCLCGSLTPATSDKVSDSSCDSPCTGYGQDDCGGNGFFSVYLTGTETNVGSAGSSSSSSGSGSGSTTTAATQQAATTTTNTAPQVVTSVAPGKTVVVTQSPSAASSTASPSPSASAAPAKSNTTAIVVGAVVGVVAAFALAGGLFFFVRHRRQRAADDEYKSHQVSDFMAGGGKPTIPALGRRSGSGPDSRFDTEAMAHRRLSDGSIVDNEDYSRRILKVTNPSDERL